MQKIMSHQTNLKKRKVRRLLMLALIPAICLSLFIGAGITGGHAYAADTNSRYSLSGAKYQIYTNKACTVKARDLDGNNAVLTTDAKGKTGKLRMAPGTYYAKEVTASKGYKLDTKVHTVKITASNTSSDPATFTSSEPPLYGVPNFRIFKSEENADYVDYKSFLGAEFTVKYYDVETKAEIKGAKAKDKWTFAVTKKDPPGWDNDPDHFYAGFDWQTDTPVSYVHEGSGKFYRAGGQRVLPLGWFTIEETKAPEGYKLSDRICYGRVFKDTETGEASTRIEGEDADGSDLRELLITDVPFGTHIKKTDSVTGKGIAGATLQLLQDDTVIDEWVTTEDEYFIPRLEEGTYTLREISAPYGYDAADDITFTVVKGQDKIIEMENTPVTVKTSASDADTGMRIGRINESETIKDNVKITGLHPGRRYRVTGTLMDKSSGLPLRDAGGSEITGSAEFEAEANDMNVEVIFTVDSSSFSPGSEAVVFETLHRTAPVHGETVPVEIQKHNDLQDEAQTITYPGISTTAIDRESGTHSISPGSEAAIQDTVRYTGLIAGETYTLEGELYDKTAEQLTGITASKSFIALTPGGTTTIDLSFDTSAVEGHTLVVYETLKSGDSVLAEHKDPEDADQTVYVPGIATSASLQKDNHEVEDVITYENLLPDRDYVFKGWLVDTVTGEKVPDSDGSVTLATGSDTSGHVVMSLNTEKYDDMDGHSLTAFEELYLLDGSDGDVREIPAASHKDISDPAQTVKIYQNLKVKKNVTGNLGDLTKVFEYTLAFTGLEPDTAYEIRGDDSKTFMSDASGKATVPLKLRDDQKATVKQLPKGAQYKVTEAASDHIAEFRLFSEDMAEKGAKIVQVSGSNDEEAAKALATALETVDMFDGTVVVLWENNRDLATLTAVQSYPGIWACGLLPVLSGALILIARRRKYKEEQEDIA